MAIQPYLFFNGRCEEAVAFYQKALGAKLSMLMRFDECPDTPPQGLPPGWERKVMHACLRVDDAEVMMSDGMHGDSSKFEGFSLSINAKTEKDAKRLFDALAAGGQVRMPLTKTFWSPCFGMLADKFGVGWMVGINPEEAKP